MFRSKVFRWVGLSIPFYFICVIFLSNSCLGWFNPCFDCSTLTYDVGNGPYSVFCGLLDGDAYADIVVANSNDDSISVLFNDGDGTFDNGQDRYAVGDAPVSVYCANINNDSYPDIVVANYGSDNITFLWNNRGTGTYRTKTNYNVGDGPRSIFYGDLADISGKDIAVVSYLDHKVYVGINTGWGTFLLSWPSYQVKNNPYNLTGADFDGDDDIDLAVIYRDDSDTGFVTILYNDGNGDFDSLRHFVIPDSTDTMTWDGSWEVCCGDWDQDDDIDLAITAVQCGHNIFIMENNGAGEFHRCQNIGVGPGFEPIFSTDLDADSTLELVTADVHDGYIFIYEYLEDAFHLVNFTLKLGKNTMDLFCADVNGDSFPDIITADSLQNTVSVIKERWDLSYWIRGDADGDGTVDFDDTTFLHDYLYEEDSPAPVPLAAGDVNFSAGINACPCDTASIDSTDIQYLTNYLNSVGSAPPNPFPAGSDTLSCPPLP